jgi:hypothetical protein
MLTHIMQEDPSVRKDSERTRTPKAVFEYFGSLTPVEPAEVTLRGARKVWFSVCIDRPSSGTKNY